jgi:hypothetical protein
MAKSPSQAKAAAEPVEQAVEENGTEPKKAPVKTFNLPGSPGSTIEVSVWLNTIELPDGGTTQGYAVSMSRSFKQGSQWSRTKSYRLADLFGLQYGIGKAIDWLMENRKSARQESEQDF